MKSTSENDNRRGLLISAGQLLFGERWQTELARALGLSDGRRIRQWLSGDRPIPVGIWDDLRELLEDRSSKMELIVKQIQASKKDKMLVPGADHSQEA
ncbi:helix-turn-helix domain-containing protein [Klebsiella pneumoniae]|uniref:helix-turn-helix domain-containing protein n=2 Tax=Klebsiella TaxID=570 RepID=UPI0011577975|nr:helix-turn-helix domain-containing protein [Klebsiella pneumoniae]